MKTIYYLMSALITLTLFASCNNRVHEIHFDGKTKKATFYRKKCKKLVNVKKPNRAFVRDGDIVNLRMDGINPFHQTVSIKKAEPVIYYQEKPKLLDNIITTPEFIKGEPNYDDTAQGFVQDTISIDNIYFAFHTEMSILDIELNRIIHSRQLDNTCVCVLAKSLQQRLNENGFSQFIKTLSLGKCTLDTSICKQGYSAYDLKIGYFNLKEKVKAMAEDSTQTKMIALAQKIQEYDNFINQVIDTYERVISANYNGFSLPITNNNSDLLDIEISFDSSKYEPKIAYNISIPVLKTLKIDYSTGVFYSRINEQTYTKTKLTDTTYNLSIKDEESDLFGPMGFINFHTSISPALKLGAFIGSGLSFNNSTKITFSSGISVILGKQQRLLLHGGLLTSEYVKYTNIYSGPFKDGAYEPSSRNKWETSFMFGISWNLTTK